MAGNEKTRSLIGNCMLALFRHRDRLLHLRDEAGMLEPILHEAAGLRRPRSIAVGHWRTRRSGDRPRAGGGSSLFRNRWPRSNAGAIRRMQLPIVSRLLPNRTSNGANILKPPIGVLDGHAEKVHLSPALLWALGLPAIRSEVCRFASELAIVLEHQDRANLAESTGARYVPAPWASSDEKAQMCGRTGVRRTERSDQYTLGRASTVP